MNFRLSDTVRAVLFLLVLSLLAFAGGVGAVHLDLGDETRVAGISAGIAHYGNFLIPKLNGEPFLEYPPLYYWITAGAFRLFGVSAAAARTPSVLGAVTAVLCAFGTARNLGYTLRTAFLSAFLLLSGAQFWKGAVTCRVDMLLAGFVMLSVFGISGMLKEETPLRRKCGFFLLFVLGTAGGILTKGLVGAMLPAVTLGSFLFFRDLLRRRFSWRSWLAAAAGGVLALLPFMLYAFFLYASGGEEAFKTLVITNNFGRFSGSQGDHVLPWYFYLVRLPGIFLPWVILLPFALVFHVQKLRKERAENSLFLLCALLIPFAVLTLASAKRQVYLMPLYGTEALLIGGFLSSLNFPNLSVFFRTTLFRRITGGVLTAAGIVFTCFAWPCAGLGICGTIFGILVLFSNRVLREFPETERNRYALCAGLLAAACLLGSVPGSFLRFRDEKNSLHSQWETCRKQLPEPVYLTNWNGKTCSPARESVRGAAVFYFGRNLPVTVSPEKLPPGTAVVCSDTSKKPMRILLKHADPEKGLK